MAINVHCTHDSGKVHFASEYFEGEQTSEILGIDGTVGWDLYAKCDELTQPTGGGVKGIVSFLFFVVFVSCSQMMLETRF